MACQFRAMAQAAVDSGEPFIHQVPARDKCARAGWLVLHNGTWHGVGMDRKPSPRSGGFFIALGAIIGVIYGSIQGQPTIGLLAGFLGGSIFAIGLWLIDRKRAD
jgi:hypothetical protein